MGQQLNKVLKRKRRVRYYKLKQLAAKTKTASKGKTASAAKPTA